MFGVDIVLVLLLIPAMFVFPKLIGILVLAPLIGAIIGGGIWLITSAFFSNLFTFQYFLIFAGVITVIALLLVIADTN